MYDTGRSAVHIAAIGGKAQRLTNLIDNDADICLKNNSDQTGIHFAMKYMPEATITALENRFDRSINLSNTRYSSIQIDKIFQCILTCKRP